MSFLYKLTFFKYKNKYSRNCINKPSVITLQINPIKPIKHPNY